jgi:uncharacterized coiled-coil protein SlyX
MERIGHDTLTREELERKAYVQEKIILDLQDDVQELKTALERAKWNVARLEKENASLWQRIPGPRPWRMGGSH